jgi:MFS family permease
MIRDGLFVSNPLHGESGSISKPSSDRSYFKPEIKKSFICNQRDTLAYSPDCGNSKYSLQGAYAWYNKLDGPMITIGAIVFVGDTSRGVLFPVLSTLNATLRGSVIDLGYLVAIFSVGRLVITAPLGYMSDKYRHKLPLLLSSSLLMFGATLWANAYYTDRLAVLYVAQFLLGVGSGSLGVTRSFVVEQCEPKKRTEALALITALQYAGFTVSPVIGSWLLTIGSNSSPYWSFALPPYFIALLALWCVVALLTVFRNIPAAPVEYTHSSKEKDVEMTPVRELPQLSQAEPPSPMESSAEYKSNLVEEGKSCDGRKSELSKASSAKSSSKCEPQQLEDAQKFKRGMFYVIIGMFLLNIATKGSISVYETLGAQIGLLDYNMSTVALGALVSGAGAVGFCQLLLFTSLWTKYFSGIFKLLIAVKRC